MDADTRSGREPGNVAVALVLALAAITAAAIGARASVTSGNAADAWQSALRTEVKRSVAAINDVSYLYQIEFPQAVRAMPAELIAAALRGVGQSQNAQVAVALEAEAAVQSEVAQVMAESTPLLGDEYALAARGFDLGRRLADIRAGGEAGPELLMLDPAGEVAEGDRLAEKASFLTYALIPASLCALLGVLAKPLRRYRLPLLVAGVAALAGAVVIAVVVELAA